jgi:hypothetical protein
MVLRVIGIDIGVVGILVIRVLGDLLVAIGVVVILPL